MSSSPQLMGAFVPQFEPLLKDEEVAPLLGGMKVKTLQRKARLGEIPGVKIGRFWYFRATSLDEWIKAQCQQPARADQKEIR